MYLRCTLQESVLLSSRIPITSTSSQSSRPRKSSTLTLGDLMGSKTYNYSLNILKYIISLWIKLILVLCARRVRSREGFADLGGGGIHFSLPAPSREIPLLPHTALSRENERETSTLIKFISFSFHFFFFLSINICFSSFLMYFHSAPRY